MRKQRKAAPLTIIKKKIELRYISAAAMRAQRLAMGLSQRSLADLIKAATGLDYMEVNLSILGLNQKLISRLESEEYGKDFGVDAVMAWTIQKILS